jgi:thiamine-phosphate pyrophosphorylase
MTEQLARFYLIVDDATWLERLLPLGVRLVQLRIKERSLDHVRREIKIAQSLCKRANAQLVVNDFWQLAIDEQCNFVHLGQEDLNTADVQSLRRANIRFGISTHSHEELERALALHPDYIALGPIYPTLLKKMPWAAQGLKRITQWKERIDPIPLVAIGGLTVERAPGVFGAGADSVAVVTDVLRHADPEARTREWLSIACG